MSTIAVAAGSDLRLGGSVSFDTVISNPDKHIVQGSGALISITAFQNGAIVWETAGRADRTFALGGQSGSDNDGNPIGWLSGPAHCRADLYGLDQSGQTTIASVEFDCAG